MAQTSVHLRAAARYGPAQVTSLSWKAQFALSSAGTLKAARRPETRMKESVSGRISKPDGPLPNVITSNAAPNPP